MRDGQMHFLDLRFKQLAPIVTAAYLMAPQNQPRKMPGKLASYLNNWLSSITTTETVELNDASDDPNFICLWCGKRAAVSPRVRDQLVLIADHSRLSSRQSPCLNLPSEAWEDPRLLSECAQCHQPVRFNPFIVDNRDRY
jgi:hypothetical protein